MTATSDVGQELERPDDQQTLASRLAWLARAQTEEEAHLIESALLARTDNGPHAGDPDMDDL
jgi:hypothetical protein